MIQTLISFKSHFIYKYPKTYSQIHDTYKKDSSAWSLDTKLSSLDGQGLVMKVPTLPRRSTAPVICVDDSDDEKDCPIFEKIDPKTRQEIQKISSVHDLTEVRRDIDGDRKMSRALSVTQDREIKDLLKTLQVKIINYDS